MPSNATEPVLSPNILFDDRGPSLRALLISDVVIMATVVSLRLWARALTKAGAGRVARFWWDDWLVLLALPLLIASAALLLDMIRLGMGRHIQVVPPENIMPLLRRFFAVYHCYNTGLTVAKASCLLFYSRIFGGPSMTPWFRRALYATHALNFGVWMGSALLISFNNNPTAQTSTGYRPSTKKMWLSSAIPGVAIDLILLILPLPIIWKLRMKGSRKLALSGVFICGYCVIVVSLGRLVSIVKGNDIEQDFTYTSIYWQVAEGPMTLLCVCMPGMLALWRRIVGLWRPQKSTNASGGNAYSLSTGKSARSKGKVGHDSGTCHTEMNTFVTDDSRDNHSQHGSESMILCPPTAVYHPNHDHGNDFRHHEVRDNEKSNNIYV